MTRMSPRSAINDDISTMANPPQRPRPRSSHLILVRKRGEKTSKD
jgi:hypothetical protein